MQSADGDNGAEVYGVEIIMELIRRTAKWRTPESMQKALNYKADPTDIFIATYPKAGTTWTQQICYQVERN